MSLTESHVDCVVLDAFRVLMVHQDAVKKLGGYSAQSAIAIISNRARQYSYNMCAFVYSQGPAAATSIASLCNSR